MNNSSNAKFSVWLVEPSEQLCTQGKAVTGSQDCLQVSEQKTISALKPNESDTSQSYKVVCTPRFIGHPHGMTAAEVRLVREAERYIISLHHPVYHATISDKNLTEVEFREASRAYRNRLGLEQRRRGLCPTYIEVREGSPHLHSHILFPIPQPTAKQSVERLGTSKFFGKDGLLIKPSTRTDGFVAYISKEREAKAAFIPGIQMAKRRPGKHPLGTLGGERVRLSKHLESRLIEDRKILPRKRKNAKKVMFPLRLKARLNERFSL